MKKHVDALRSVLCDPQGKCCIKGSDEDRRIVDEALAGLSNQLATLPSEEKEVELKTLKGAYSLSGIETRSVRMKLHDWSDEEDHDVVLFILDGVTYKAVEDLNDGYRSQMGSFTITNDVVYNTFDPVDVLCLTDVGSEYHSSNSCDLLQILNAKTGDEILKVGTDNIDDYYPSFVCNFSAAAIGELEGLSS